MGKIVAVANQKGGVGKTTTAVNLAANLARAGQRSLLVDLDPQGNTTSGLDIGLPPEPPLPGIMKSPAAWRRWVVASSVPRLDVLPAHPENHRIPEPNLREPERYDPLRNEIHQEYEFAFLDCPPTLGPIPLFALLIADSVLIPVQCEYFAMEGLSQMIPTVRAVEKARGRPLPVEGLLLTMFCEDLDLSWEVLEEVKKHFPEETLETIIPRDVALAEAMSHSSSIDDYAPRSRGCWAYLNLAKEIMSHGVETAG